MNVILVDGEIGSGGIYGLAGDIPAPLVPTPDSAVLISMDMARGPDALFSEEEVRILGETMAHEVGHLLGLFHPVEIDLDAWDALEDTPRCERTAPCERQLGDNVMFPYPVQLGRMRPSRERHIGSSRGRSELCWGALILRCALPVPPWIE